MGHMAQAKKATKKTGTSVRSAKESGSGVGTPDSSAESESTSAAMGKSLPGTDLKQRFAALANATGRITTLKRSLNKNFFEVGELLNEIRDSRLYEVKGYGSFESFVERELDINKVTCLRSARIAEAMDRTIATEAGLDRASAAVAILDGESSIEGLSVRSPSGAAAPLVPLHKQ